MIELKTVVSKMRIKASTTIKLNVSSQEVKTILMANKTVKFINTGIADSVIFEIGQLADLVPQLKLALKSWNNASSLWVVYPKSNQEKVYDVNRDILWKEVRKLGFDLVANIAISDNYSSVRIKKV